MIDSDNTHNSSNTGKLSGVSFAEFWEPITRSPGDPLHSSYQNDEAVVAIIPNFVNNLPDHLQDMWKAHLAGDHLALRGLAHQLKGSSGLYGYLSMSVLAGGLEASIRLEHSTTDQEIEQYLFQIAQLAARAIASIADTRSK
jgi:HPt (histidine-containing phosphotransfer) domain-containing protein